MRTLPLIFGLFMGLQLHAQTREVRIYYSPARNASGATLKTALHKVIKEHEMRTYKQVWEDFGKTDTRADNTVCDIYGDTKYIFSQDQDRGYSTPNAYNREHSFPKSWFGDNQKYPMYTDLFHLYPADKTLNSTRNNFPYGDIAEGYNQLGENVREGYKGKVFEPCDSLKGDLARTYFYMVTTYEDRIAKWRGYEGGRAVLDGKNYPGLSEWQLKMMLEWAKQDPVSPKEKARNEAVWGIQHNRNPYIDYPGLEAYVWGEKKDVAPDLLNYTNPYTQQKVNEETFAETDLKPMDHAPLPIDSIGAMAVGKVRPNVFGRIQHLADLAVGRRCMIVARQSKKSEAFYAMGSDFSKNPVSIDEDSVRNSESNAIFLLEKAGKNYALRLTNTTMGTARYLACQVVPPKTSRSKEKYNLTFVEQPNAETAQWEISLTEGGQTTIANIGVNSQAIRFDNTKRGNKFALQCDKGVEIELFVEGMDVTTGIGTLHKSNVDGETLYDLSGRRTSTTHGIAIKNGRVVILK